MNLAVKSVSRDAEGEMQIAQVKCEHSPGGGMDVDGTVVPSCPSLPITLLVWALKGPSPRTPYLCILAVVGGIDQFSPH